jgi:tRNA threonylcarbamoyladenosine biosynthesis protein TsaB
VPVRERRHADARVLCAVDTKRGDIYAHIFDNHLLEISAPHVLTPAQLRDTLAANTVVAVGDAAAIAVSALGPHATLSSADALPDPAVIAQCAASRQPTAAGPLPVYVRPPDAVVPPHGGRLRT